MPITRASSSKTRKKAKKSVTKSQSGDTGSDLEEQANSVVEGVKSLRAQLHALQRENVALKEQLEAKQHETTLHSDSDSDKKVTRNSSNATLKRRVRELEAGRQKDAREIKMLRAKEISQEAADLKEQTGVSSSEDDIVTRMRKLMHRFSELMLVTTLADDEECPVCFEKLQLKHCSSSPCQHLICNDCSSKLPTSQDAEGADTVSCPTCREKFTSDDFELVPYTEVERWDALLAVAEEWAECDPKGGEETSEEEEEEEDFIEEDVEDRAEDVSMDDEDMSSKRSEEEETLLYSQSPTKGKRARLERLVKERNMKKRRM